MKKTLLLSFHITFLTNENMVFAATKKMTLPVGTDLVHTVFVISQLLKAVPSVSVLMCVLWQVVQKQFCLLCAAEGNTRSPSHVPLPLQVT